MIWEKLVDNEIHCLAVSPDGHKILIACDSHWVSLWDSNGGELARLQHSPAQVAKQACWNHDGSRILTRTTATDCGDTGEVGLWNANGQLLALHKQEVVQDCAFSPDGARFFSCSVDSGSLPQNSTVRVFGAGDGKVLGQRTFSQTRVRSGCFREDGSALALATNSFEHRRGQNGVLLLDPLRLTDISRLEIGNPTDKVVCAGGNRLATYVWRPSDECVAVYQGASLQPVEIPFQGNDPTREPRFSPDGNWLFITSARESEAFIWDSNSGQSVNEISTPLGCFAASFSPDGRYVATGGMMGVQVWNAATGKPICSLLEDEMITALSFGSDCQTLAIARSGVNLGCWRLAH